MVDERERKRGPQSMRYFLLADSVGAVFTETRFSFFLSYFTYYILLTAKKAPGPACNFGAADRGKCLNTPDERCTC